MGTQVPIPVQSSPNREKAMKESKLAILLLCLGCFLPINKVQGDCVRGVLLFTFSDRHYMGYYHKTGQTSRGRPVWRMTVQFQIWKWKDYCIWMAAHNYWWVGPCSKVGRSSGLAYLENKTRCPYDSRNQVWRRAGSNKNSCFLDIHSPHLSSRCLRCSQWSLREVEESGFERLNATTFSVISEATCLK